MSSRVLPSVLQPIWITQYSCFPSSTIFLCYIAGLHKCSPFFFLFLGNRVTALFWNCPRNVPGILSRVKSEPSDRGYVHLSQEEGCEIGTWGVLLEFHSVVWKAEMSQERLKIKRGKRAAMLLKISRRKSRSVALRNELIDSGTMNHCKEIVLKPFRTSTDGFEFTEPPPFDQSPVAAPNIHSSANVLLVSLNATDSAFQTIKALLFLRF